MISALVRRLVAPAAILGMTACGTVGTLGTVADVLGGVLGQPAAGGQAQVAVEILGVNAQQQTLQVATQDGRSGNVRYDGNTVVVYRQQQYPVTALERGDLATITVQDVQGATYVSRVDVQQSARERTGTGAVVQLGGRVTQIDQNSGAMVLQTSGGNVTVHLAVNAPQATVNYFRQLRVGHQVQLEATMISSTRAEIHRFL
jgi:hypothetical protein